MKPSTPPHARACSSRPALAVFGFAVLLPMVLTVGYSFTDWNGFGPMTFVGLDNYVRAAATTPSSAARSSTSLIYIAATLVLEVHGRARGSPASSARGPGGLWFRVAIFTPGDAADGGRRGPVVVRLQPGLRPGQRRRSRRSGLEELQRIWLGDPSTALLAISVVSGWVFAGFYMMIFYAAFRQVPSEVLEAARLDGAGEWALFRRIKVPDDPQRRRRSPCCCA